MKKYLMKVKWWILASMGAFFVETIITSIILYLPGYLIDNFKNNESIYQSIFVYLAVFVFYLVTCYSSNRIADYRRIVFEKAIKSDLFSSVMNRSYNEFQQYNIGEYISMQSNDVTEICQNYLSPFVSIFRSVIMIVIFGVVLVLTVDVSIAIAIICLSVLTVFIPQITAKELSKRNHAHLEQVGKYTTKVTEYYGMHTILDNKSRPTVINVHAKELDEVFDRNMFFRKLNSFSYVLNGGSVEFIAIVTFIMVGVLLINGSITVGSATVAFMYSSRFTEPISELNLNISRVKSVKKIQEKLNEILDFDHSANKQQLDSFEKIYFKNVKKQFDTCKISLPNMVFEKGKKYLIIGDNGVGKSVSLKILMKFYQPDEGEVYFDKLGLNDIDINCLNAYVPQSSIVFDSSYYNNVTIYGTYVENLEFYESLFPIHIISKIKASDSIMDLSGGEKQVVSLIRSLCMNKPVLLLDESFSAMNRNTIDIFMDNLEKIDRTIILIAHNFDNYFDKFSHVYCVKAEG